MATTKRIALCVDEATCASPELLGLDGEMLDAQEWLDVFMTGDEARIGVQGEQRVSEAWVASCEDVEPINLAATLKADRPDLTVRLVSEDTCGSLFSRARTAAIDEVLNTAAFAARYAEEKARCSRMPAHAAPERVYPQEAPPAAQIAPPDTQAALPSMQATPPGMQPAPPDTQPAPPDTQPAPPDTQPAPPDTHTASQDMQQALARPQVALARPHALVAQNRGFLMPIVSGSGGAGKSTVAVMSAFAARDMGYRTLLLDYDLQFGDVAVLAGVEDALAVDEAIARPDKLEREMGRDPMLTVIAAPDRLEASEEVVSSIPTLLDQVAGSFDVIIANTGGAWADQHAVLLERSYVALFLIDQRASSIRACKHALELCARCGIATGPFEFALNRCSKGAPLTPADVSSALQGPFVYELKDGGRDVEDYLGGGAAGELLSSGNEFCASLREMVAALLPAKARASGADGAGGPQRPARRKGLHVGRRRGRKS